MKRTVLALYLMLASGGSLFAAEAGDDGFTIRCSDIRLPPLTLVGTVTGVDDAGAIYRTRDTLLHQAERLCKRNGVGQVRFVPDSEVSVEPLRSVATR